MSLIGDERVINLQRTKVNVFSDSVLCLGKIPQNPETKRSIEAKIRMDQSSQSYRNFHRIDGRPTAFEWNIFRGFNTLQFCEKVKVYSRDWRNTRNFERKNTTHVDVNDISCGTRDNEKECLAMVVHGSRF